MRQQFAFIQTLRDVPADAEINSHQLMLRASLIRQVAAGVYTFLPLGKRVLQKVEQIVRDEMDRAGGQEILMPAVQPAELWKESGRWDVYGPELMRLTDRNERLFALGPTHEEVITHLVRDVLQSYKKMPATLYQIQTKYRDERRPRFGLLRSREFIMKDAYSFDTSEEGLDKSYWEMYAAYERIFSRCGLNYRAVEADSGAIGGTGTHEFMVLSDVGEDTIVHCSTCRYAANLEMAEAVADEQQGTMSEAKSQRPIEKVHTPNVKTIEEVSAFLHIPQQQTVKTMAYQIDDQLVVALVRGDYQLNDVKIKNAFGANIVEPLTEAQIKANLQSTAGYIGPIGLPDDITVIADHSVQALASAVLGANEKEYHWQHVHMQNDVKVDRYADIREVVEGDLCPRCGQGTLQFTRGIEAGHVFKLGTKYSEAMDASFLDDKGKSQPIIMGCYGIGVSRLLAAIVEQHHDDNGIVWPDAVAPFDVHVIAVNMKNNAQHEVAEKLYRILQRARFDVLLDDRKERAGVKLNDADLIGIPWRIVVGKRADEGIVEIKRRDTDQTEHVAVDQVEEYLCQER